MAYTRNPNSIRGGVGISQSPTNDATDNPSGALTLTLNADIATTSTPGIVIIGDNIQITPTGIISVAAPGVGFTGSQGNSGAVGFTGSQGAPGSGEICSAKTVSNDYTVLVSDYYIGVKSTHSTTITLPSDPTDCLTFLIKAQMGPPMGLKKIKVVAQGSATIDGLTEYIMTIPYESVTVISNGGNWWIV